MKKTIKTIITIFLFLSIFLIPVSFADELSPIDKFKNNVHNAYNFYKIYDYVLETEKSDEIELIITEGCVNDKLSMSIYYQPINENYSTTLRIIINNETFEYDFINANNLYNISYEETDNVTVYILNNEDENNYKFKYDKTYSIEDLNSFGERGLGTGEFPKSEAQNATLSLKGCLVISSVTGIFIIGILIIVISVMIATKKINIKREPRPTIYYTPKNNNFEQHNNTENKTEDIIDVNDTEIKEEPEIELSEEEELKRLYSLRARNEITEEELNILLRRYRGKRDDD